MTRIPLNGRIDRNFYEAYLASKQRGEVVKYTEFQRKVAEILKENINVRLRFFK